jgi:hypothetical protein
MSKGTAAHAGERTHGALLHFLIAVIEHLDIAIFLGWTSSK